MKRKKLLPFFIAIAVVVVFNVLFTIQTAASGSDLNDLGNEKLRLIEQNDKLKNQLIEESSLSGLKEKATDLGFGKPATVVYVEKVEQVAKLP